MMVFILHQNHNVYRISLKEVSCMKKANRLISVLVVLLMLATTACGTAAPAVTTAATTAAATTAAATTAAATEAATEAATTEATTVATTEAAPTVDIMTPYGKYPETITMSIPKRSSADPRFPDGQTVENNAMTRFLLDRLNVQVKIAWEVEQSEYINKLSLNIASNDLPDAFTLDATANYLVYKQLVENDMLADLTEGYALCAGEYMKSTFGSFKEMNLEPFKENGKLFGIAGGYYGYEHNILWLRQDWLTECNLQAPKTLAELKNVIKTFKDKNMGGKGNVGLVMDAQNPMSHNMFAATPIAAAFGAYPQRWIKDASGKVVWGSVAPEMKPALAEMAAWYKEGLIDKQFPTRTASGATDALIKDAQSGAFFAPWWITYVLFPDFVKNNPNAEVMPFNAPLDASGKFNIMWPGPANTVICINKKFSNPEAVVKMLNVEFDAWRSIDADLGALVQPYKDKGTDWTYLFPTGGVNLEYADIVPAVGFMIKDFIDKGTTPPARFTEFDKGMAKDAKTWTETKSLDNSGWIQYYGRYFASTIVNAPETVIKYPAFSFATESMADLKANLDKMEQEVMLQIILGEKPIDYFDTFVADWYKQGGDVMTKEVTALVK